MCAAFNSVDGGARAFNSCVYHHRSQCDCCDCWLGHGALAADVLVLFLFTSCMFWCVETMKTDQYCKMCSLGVEACCVVVWRLWCAVVSMVWRGIAAVWCGELRCGTVWCGFFRLYGVTVTAHWIVFCSVIVTNPEHN